MRLAARIDRLAARIHKLQPQAVGDVRRHQAASALFDVLAAHLPYGPPGPKASHDKEALRAAAARIAAGQPNDADAAMLAALPRAELRVMGYGPAKFIALVASLPTELTPEEEAELQAYARSVQGAIPSIRSTRRG